MKIMSLLLLLLSTTLWSESIKFKIDYEYATSEHDDITSNSSRTSVNVIYKNNITSKLKINSKLTAEKYCNAMLNKYAGSKDRSNETHFLIQTLYLQYKATENISIMIGTIPILGERLEDSDNSSSGANGLKQMIGTVTDSIVINTNYNDFKTTIGLGCFMCINNQIGSYAVEKAKNSVGMWIFNNKKYEKMEFDLDYYEMKFLLNGEDYSYLKSGGFGIKYDDTEYSGITLYSSLAISEYEESYSLIPYKKEIGQSFLLGVNIDSDIVSKYVYEFRYGIEYYSSSKYWTNMTTDNYLNIFDDNVRGNFYSLYLNISPIKSLSIDLKYNKNYIDYITSAKNTHLNPVSVDMKVNSYSVRVNYKF